MATLHVAFLDEAGTHQGSPVVIVGGFVSSVNRWVKFCDDWGAALRDHEIEYFHMSTFNSHQGMFKGWPESRRRNFLRRLLDIIAKHSSSSVGVAIPTQSFESVASQTVKDGCGGAYGLGVLSCIKVITSNANKEGALVDYRFEDGSHGKGNILDIFAKTSINYRDRIADISFRDKRKYPPLQAADLLVNELFKDFPRALATSREYDMRYPLIYLRQSGMKNEWYHLDEIAIQEWNRALL